jgi:hypothetical protein
MTTKTLGRGTESANANPMTAQGAIISLCKSAREMEMHMRMRVLVKIRKLFAERMLP